MPNGKLEYWTIDIITGLPEVDGFNALLVCVDKFGKLCCLIPCRAGESELSAPAIARLFFDNVIRFFGVPRYVLLDRDPQFTAAFWKELWKIMGCKMVFTSAYHP